MKFSFLIAAHNEEKIIYKTLKNLISLPYEDYEVIIGLDGCTDRTEEIVREFSKKSSKIKYYSLKSRGGKPEVIDKIFKKSIGEIIIINDADWVFKVKERRGMERIASIFEDPSIGGIAESFPVEWHPRLPENSNLGYKMVSWGTYYWMDYQKKIWSRECGNGKKIAKTPRMFLTNIFRRELYIPNQTLGDDFERTGYIMSQGKQIILLDDLEAPRMVASYSKVGMKDFLRQKTRTAIARRQLKKVDQTETNFSGYYLPAVSYMLRKSWSSKIGEGILVTLWVFLTSLGAGISRFKTEDTKEQWKLRAQR